MTVFAIGEDRIFTGTKEVEVRLELVKDYHDTCFCIWYDGDCFFNESDLWAKLEQRIDNEPESFDG